MNPPLTEAETGHGTGTKPPDAPTAPPPPAGRTQRRTRRRILLAAGVLSLVALAWTISQRSEHSRQAERAALARAVADLDAGLDRLFGSPAPRLTPAPGMYLPDAEGSLVLLTPESPVRAPERLVVLVHGLDDPGDIWDDLLPVVREAGLDAAVFEYPNDGPIAASADLLLEQLRLMHDAGTRRVDLVCHSMGGLVAFDALTRAGEGAASGVEVGRLITVGTPFGGSPWARARALAEAREHALRWLGAPTLDPRAMLSSLEDGLGEAGEDLMPGSAYLESLLHRSLPDGVALTVIAGRLAAEDRIDTAWLASSWLARRLLGDVEASRLASELERAADTLGDGVVPLDAALHLEADDTVLLEASHRGLVRLLTGEQRVRLVTGTGAQSEPPAIPVIIERLRE